MSRDPSLVAVLVADDAPMFETAVPFGVFGVDRSDVGGPRYSVMAVGVDAPAAATTAGVQLAGLRPLDAMSTAGVVVVPTWPDPHVPAPALLAAALVNAYDEGAIIVGLCLGTFVLADAGLLDGRRATTHWRCATIFRERFPRVILDHAVLYVDEGQLITSAGTAAGIDACLHLVRREHGAQAAAVVARSMVVPPHRSGGQAQYIDSIGHADVGPGPIGELLAWLVENLDSQIDVSEMADRLHTSRRTFDRQFRAATGVPPLRWLLQQRVVAAQQLLEATDLPVDLVARKVGFASAIALRPHFRQVVGVSPTQYRKTFHRIEADQRSSSA